MILTYIFCIEREELISMETLKVGTKSNPNSVAGALAGVVASGVKSYAELEKAQKGSQYKRWCC